MRHAVWMVICLVCMSAFGQAPPAAPSAPEAPLTERKVFELWQEYEFQAMITPYKKSAFTDPKWNRKVDELYQIAARNYSRRDSQTPRQIELLSHIQNAGCKDPLVTWMAIASKTFDNTPKSKIARSAEECEELLQSLVKNGYGKIRQWRLIVYIRSLKETLGEDRSQIANWTSCCEDGLVAAASEPNISPMVERLIFDKFKSDMNGSIKCYTRALCDKINASTASTWMKGCINGEFHVKEAWNRRGSGWAGTVNEAGWKGFASELADAHDAFVAAYQNDPSRPEPAAGLIVIAGASHDFPNETPSLWFDRAVKAQFDYADAYITRRWYLRPRWGGSHDAMLKAATEWVATKRFDTYIPEMYLWTLDDICADRGEYETIWQEPGVIAVIEQLRDGYLAQKDPYFNTILSRVAHVLWIAGRRAEAKDLVDQLGEGFAPRTAAAFCLPLNEFRAVHAYAPSIRAATLAADEAAESKDYDKSVSLLTEAKAAHTDLPEEVRQAVDQKIALFKFRKSLDDHQWTSLILGDSPQIFFDDGIIPKAWEFTADSIRLTARNSWWGEFRFLPKVGTRYEMRSRITVPADGQSDNCRAGFMVFFNIASDSPYWQSIYLAPFQKVWTTGACWTKDDPKPIESGNPVDLLVKVWDDEVVIKVDGTVLYAGPAVSPDRTAPVRDQVGLAAADRDPASGPVEFREPSIRLLQARPAELAKEDRPIRRPRPVPNAKPRF
ncbi:MAG: hypothetical protein ACREJD_02480 [Phycisphaerales bacterium]